MYANKITYSIWTPESRSDAWDMALMLSKGNESAAHDLVLCHAAFGHHFNYDMGLVLVNTASIKGRPTMRADALAGICRSTGNVKRLQVVKLDRETCIVECERADTRVQHRYEFNMQMAQDMNLTNNQNWRRMPKQMLRARAVAMACRAVWPDAVSGIYTSDEMADSMDMTDKERFEATARSLGEDDLRYDSRPPAPAPEPEPIMPPPADQTLYAIDTEEDLMTLCEEHNIDEGQVRGCARARKITLSALSPQELHEFFYSYCLHHVYRQMHNLKLDNWWKLQGDKADTVHNAFIAQYPALTIFKPAFYGPRITVPAWAETLRHVCTLETDEHKVEGLEVLRNMAPDDWSAYDYVLGLGKG